MDQSLSTTSQTHRSNRVKRLAQFFKGTIESPRLQKNFERLQAEQNFQLMQNRIEKLQKIESTMNKEIDFADQKAFYLTSLHQDNLLQAQKKQELKKKIQESIEIRRKSLSISRQESRTTKEKVLNEIFEKKRSKAQMLKALKNDWKSWSEKRKNQEIKKKKDFAKKVMEIKKKNIEIRSRSQASERKENEKRFWNSVERKDKITRNVRNETFQLALIEEKIVERLADTINLRNQRLNGLNQLMAISKLPLSMRSV
jgi:hypothetical protein